MAKNYLTAEELQMGNAWLKTVFFPSVKDNLDSNYLQYSGYRDEIMQGCKVLYDLIVKKTWDTTDTLYFNAVHSHYLDQIGYRDSTGASYSLKSKLIFKILANMCQKAGILWDDTTHTSQELDYFKKTEFGTALWDFYCFVSQDPDDGKLNIKVNTKQSSNSSTQRTPRASSSSSGATGSGHTLYRSNCGGLVGGSKETGLSQENGYMFWIGGEFVKAGKTQPRIHVSPQDSASPLTVKFNSGQGYNDCVLYFKSSQQAQAFLDICNQNLPSNVKLLQIKKVWEDTNGYCEVHTQYGNAYILAKKLHEDLEEEVDEPEQIKEDYERVITEACDALMAFME